MAQSHTQRGWQRARNWLAAAAALCTIMIATVPVRAADTSGLPTIPIEKYTLANGLDVILVEDKRLPLVAVNVWYKVGAANEEPGLTGFAHLFEHMMFAATKHVPRGMADRLLESVGGTDSNGSTSPDRTNYYDTVPAHQLELALWIHADRMGFLLDVLDQEALSNQQDVVRNERRQRVENQPYGLVQEALWHTLFPADHPYHADVIGSHADIQNARLADIKRFFKRYYRPNNASLSIVGDFDKAKVKRLVEHYYGGFARGETIPPLKLTQPRLSAEKRVVVTDRVELPKVILGWHTPAAFAPGDAELSLLGQLLGVGKSSRLYKSLVYEQQIAQEVTAYNYSLKQGSVFVIDVTAKPGVSAEKLEAAVDAELAKLRAAAVARAEVERARNVIETDLIASLQKVGGAGLAERLSYYNFYTGEPDYLAKEVAAYRAATPEGIQREVLAWLANDRRVVIHGIPGAKDLGPNVPTPTAAPAPGQGTESLNVAEPWRARVPAPAQARAIALPQPTRFKLKNGLTVLHHREPNLPLVSAHLAFAGGSDANPAARPGLASFTAAMLDEGTRTRTSAEIADELARLGATLSIDAAAESTSARVFALKRNSAQALGILADVVLNPVFAEPEINRLKERRIADLALNRTNPQVISAIAAAAALYGERHPLGYLDIGTEAAVRSFTRDEVVAFWRQQYTPANAALVLVGDLTRGEAETLANAAFGSWRGVARVAAKAPQRTTTPARLIVVDLPDSPQSAIRVVTEGPRVSSPDLPDVEVMNSAFGGLFTSRVNDLLREKKGYTYGAYTRVDARRESGFITLRGNIRADVTGPALADVFGEIDGMASRPVVGAELVKARDSNLQSLPGQFETLGAIGGSFAYLFTAGLPLDHYKTLPARLARVDQRHVAATVKRYLIRDRFKLIVTGDRKVIDPQLAALGVKPIEYRDANGKVMR